MAINFESGKPIFLQIEEHLRNDIAAGRYSPDEKLPGVRDLALWANVNPNTMQKALALLENEGLLVTNSTVGRTVTDDEAVLDEARRKALDSFTVNIIKEAKNMSLDMKDLIRNIEKGWEKDE